MLSLQRQTIRFQKQVIRDNLEKIKAVVFDVDGVLSAETIPMDANGEPLRTVDIKDGYAIQLAVKQGLRVAIITGGYAKCIETRYKYLGVSDIYMRASVKMEVYERFLAQYGLRDEEVLYMGDDIPDLEVMRRCGCPCCPKDACADIKAVARYVSPRRGGCGCVRDVLEQVLRCQGKWLAGAKAFGW